MGCSTIFFYLSCIVVQSQQGHRKTILQSVELKPKKKKNCLTRVCSFTYFLQFYFSFFVSNFFLSFIDSLKVERVFAKGKGVYFFSFIHSYFLPHFYWNLILFFPHFDDVLRYIYIYNTNIIYRKIVQGRVSSIDFSTSFRPYLAIQTWHKYIQHFTSQFLLSHQPSLYNFFFFYSSIKNYCNIN